MKNIHFVLRYLATEQIKIETEDIGLTYPRKVIFEPATGKVFKLFRKNSNKEDYVEVLNTAIDQINQ